MESKHKEKEEEWVEETNEGKVPEIVKEEPNDKPAAKNLRWTILISVVVLLIIYLIFFHPMD